MLVDASGCMHWFGVKPLKTIFGGCEWWSLSPEELPLGVPPMPVGPCGRGGCDLIKKQTNANQR